MRRGCHPRCGTWNSSRNRWDGSRSNQWDKAPRNYDGYPNHACWDSSSSSDSSDDDSGCYGHRNCTSSCIDTASLTNPQITRPISSQASSNLPRSLGSNGDFSFYDTRNYTNPNKKPKTTSTNSQVTTPTQPQASKPPCTTSYALRTQDTSESPTASCPICYEAVPISNTFLGQQCTHDYGDAICNPCATTYIRGIMANGKTDFKCVAKGCKTSFSIDDLKLLTYNEIIALDRGAK